MMYFQGADANSTARQLLVAEMEYLVNNWDVEEFMARSGEKVLWR